MDLISLVVPVYNECESLPLLFQKISDVMLRINRPWELIFIDDGSTDGSTEILTGLARSNSNVVLALQRRNFGKSLALNVGFELARGEILVTLDADLQDEPEEIPNLLAKLSEGYDVVSGWKKDRKDPLSKTVPSRIANGMTSLMTGVNLHDMNSGFKAYRTSCVRKLSLYGDLHRYIPALAEDAGFKVTEIPVVHHKRQFGHSKYGPGRLMSAGFDLITVVFLSRYRRRPLHLFGGAGALMLFVGLLINVWLTLQWFQGAALSSRPLLILGVLLMLMGVQLLTIGLLAELLVSYIQRNENPLNTVRAIYGGSEPEFASTSVPSQSNL
jgi:glycosyltransferase involved in cell wall biosynthesis